MQLAYVEGATMRERISITGLIETMRAGHREPAPEMERVYLAEPGTDNGYLVWHAWAPGSLIATKMGTIFPANPSADPPRPTVQCLITLFDGATGTPMALLDGTELTYWKTAASSALAADYLARADARTLMMVGAGSLAPYMVMAHRAVRPGIERVLIWNRTPAAARALTSNPLVGPGASAVDDLRAGVEQADIICCATAARTPLVLGAWLREGAHLDLVGGYTPEMRESDDEAARRSRLFVDATRFNIDACGDLCQPIAAGVRLRSDVEADTFGLCRGEHPGRGSAGEITLFKSGGGAHLDLLASRYVVDHLL